MDRDYSHRVSLIKILGFALIAWVGSYSISFAQTVTTNAYDNGRNYVSGWTNGANGGNGFQPWVLTSGNGTGGYGGYFVGNPGAGGITGMNSSSFALYANPKNSGAYANAERGFSKALEVGQTLSFQWGINFDSGSTGSKGVVFSAGGNEISALNLNNAGTSVITIGGSDVGFGYGTAVMTWSLTRTGDKLYKVVANDRDGNGVYSNNITVSNGAMDQIKFYASNMQGGNEAQPYFDELTIITTDTDNVAPSIALAQGVEQVTWVAKNSAFTLSVSDVTASDNSGTVDVTLSPPSVDTTVDGLTKVTYTAADPTGNTASVVRVVAVGDAAPGWCKLHYPKSATASAISPVTVYGRIYIDGATPGLGQAPNITAELGVNITDSDPSGWTGVGVWKSATLNAGFTGGDDEYEAAINGSELAAGTYYYAYRFKIGNGAWQYAGINSAGTDGGPWDGTTSVNGVLSVVPVRDVTFAVDMNVQISKGTFIPTSGQGVELKGSFNNGWNAAGVAMSDLDGDGIYTVTLPIQGNASESVVYKFRVTGSALGGLEWEGSSNRPLVLGSLAETLKPVTFSNEGTTFAVWSGGASLNAENLAKYAVGGANGLSGQGEAPRVGSGYIVPRHYSYIEAIVRTDDSKLTIVGQASTDLAAEFDSTGQWTTEGASLGVSQVDVPAGCERKRFIYWHGMAQSKMFLRLKATLAP